MARLAALLCALLALAACAAPTSPAAAPAGDDAPAPVLAAAPDAKAPPAPGKSAPPPEPDRRCQVDADCAVKDVGNCCGYYPACVNRDSPTYPEQVKAACRAEGMSAICGFPEIAGCRCVEGLCEASQDAGAPGGRED